MCGIAGFTIPTGLTAAQRRQRYGEAGRAMAASLYHRGPDAQRTSLLDGVVLAHTRLSIVDLAQGHQPMSDAGTGVTVCFNGEIFNWLELKAGLGDYAFRTTSDTEVILAAYLARGIDCVKDFVGQFAFAVWDPRDATLWLARDHVGIVPLFMARTAEGLAFASEIKALFASGLVRPKLDARGLVDAVHLWAPMPPRTQFEGVEALQPGFVAKVKGGVVTRRRYWAVDLSDEVVERDLSMDEAVERVSSLLADAVRLRLRADVPVGAYLSGGLDSSLTCGLAQRQLGGTLQTYSVGFAQARYDERGFQQGVAEALGTQHHVVEVQDADIGRLLPEVVWHGEQVLVRSAPAPFFTLSGLVRRLGTKVVLTGEGADEVFLGYDIYKETKVRQFWARQPASTCRPRLFSRMYPFLPLSQQSPEVLKGVFGEGFETPGALDFSHRVRWNNTGRIARFFSKDFAAGVADYAMVDAVAAQLPPGVASYRPLARAQALEMATLLSGYLLSAQGDRMLMGHSVEGRFPFLDHRLIELAARLPDRVKLKSLDEKAVLKRAGRGLVPPQVLARTKFPYRAPIAEALVGRHAPDWSAELLSKAAVDDTGVYDGAKVEKLVAKLAKATAQPSEADNMALVAIATTQLLARAFVQRPHAPDAAHLDAVLVEDSAVPAGGRA